MSLATKPLHLAMLVLCGCNCESSGHSEEDAERDTHWAELSFCLSGTETPAPERIARITLAAELEDVEGLEVPALPQSGAMGVPLDERGPDRRRWPTRCGPYAHALEESLEGAPAERAAQEVTSALRRGEVDSALYLLAEYARTWHAVTAVGVTPPPAPAAPLARADARFVVEGPRCRATSVVQDASVFPPRHVAHVSCGDGERHECTLSGVALDTITCTPEQAPRARPLDEAIVGDWTLLRRRHGEQCTFAARFGEREEELGEAECGSDDRWIRACRGEGFLGAALLHTFESSPPAHVAILDEGAFRWVEAPVFPSRQHVVSCDANAMRFTHTSRRSEFVTDGMRPGMLRPPTQGFIMLGTHRCTAEGCEASSTELLSTGGRWETAAPVGEELVVVEAHHREDGDGLVARIAPLDELADAPALWVFDPADGIEFEGASVFRMWALGPRAAVLLLTDVTRGVMAVRFEAGGGFSYLAPAR